MSETDPRDIPLPPEMYKGGFRDSSKVVDEVIDRFGLTRPLTLYYPGSSTDVSLLDLSDVHVIHVDKYLNEDMLAGFSALGAEAHNADAHEWQPPSPVDMVVFINPSGIDEGEVLANANLGPKGLVLWYFWSGRPTRLQETEGLELVGAVKFGEEEGFEIDTQQLENYFVLRPFEELSEAEQQDFITKVDTYMERNNFQFSPDNNYSTVYASWQRPEGRFSAERADVHNFPHRKDAPCFIYQKTKNPLTTAR